MITFRPPQDMEDALNKLSAETKRSKSYYLTEALGEYLAKQQEIHEAVVAYEKYLKEGGKPWKDVKKEMGISDGQDQ